MSREWLLRIVRLEDDGERTFGVAYVGEELGDEPVCLTLERPWLDNRRYESCIPPGEYPARLRNGAADRSKFRYIHVEIEDVPNRSAILIHAGNRVTDSLGCVLTGTDRQGELVVGSMSALNCLILSLAAFGSRGRVRIAPAPPPE